MAAFIEYQRTSNVQPLRQGDILEAVDLTASMWRRRLLVITADCDFARDKHGGRVTCVSVLDAADYLIEFSLPKQRDKLVAAALLQARAVLKRHGFDLVTNERLEIWLNTATEETLLATGLPPEAALKLLPIVKSLQLVRDAPRDVGAIVEAISEAQTLLTPGQNRDTCRRKLRDVLRESVVNAPGDVFFVGSISADDQNGYFIHLRIVEQVLQSQIAVGGTRKVHDFRRVSKLHDRLVFAASQRFAAVFNAIALPKDYEDMRSLHADNLVNWEVL